MRTKHVAEEYSVLTDLFSIANENGTSEIQLLKGEGIPSASAPTGSLYFDTTSGSGAFYIQTGTNPDNQWERITFSVDVNDDSATTRSFTSGDVMTVSGHPEVGNTDLQTVWDGDNLRVRNIGIWQKFVLGRSATPAVGPSTGDAWIVAPGATGAWSGLDDDIVVWNSSAWVSLTLRPEHAVYNLADDQIWCYHDAAWNPLELRLNTASFNGMLTAAEDTAQEAFDKIDDHPTSGTFLDGGHTYLVPKHEAASSPTINDDIDSYKVGTVWINTTTDEVFVCTDNTNGAAVWAQVDGAGSGFINGSDSLRVNGTETTIVINGVTIDVHSVVHDEGVLDITHGLHKHSDTAAAGPVVEHARSRGTEASESVVQSGDTLARWSALGFDGTDYERAVEIKATVSTTPGSNDMPGKLDFLTTPDGSVTPISRMTIDHAGAVNITGSLTLGTELAVAEGGTGAGNAGDARTNLGAAPSDATYIVESLSSGLSAERAITAGTGIILSTPGSTMTVSFDGTNTGNITWGSGSTVTWTVNAGAVDPTIQFSTGEVRFNSAHVNVDFVVEGDTDTELLWVDAGLDKVGISTNVPAHTLDVAGSFGAHSIRSISGSGPTTLDSTDMISLVSLSGGVTHTVNLPAASGCTGRFYMMVRTDTDFTSTLTVDPNGTDAWEGTASATYSLAVGGKVIFFSDGAGWWLISQ